MEKNLDWKNVFPPASREDWEKKVELELKGKSFESLKIDVDLPVRLSPFYTRKEHEKIPEINLIKQKKGWEIGEAVDASDLEKANTLALNALEMGAESIRFYNLVEDLDAILPEKLLRGIMPDLITLVFELPEETVAHKTWLTKLARYQALNSSESNRIYFEKTRLKPYAATLFPNSRYIPIYLSKGALDPSTSVYEGISKALAELDSQREKSSSIFFITDTGCDYLVEIARLRALRWLWAKAQLAMGRKEQPAFIQVEFHADAYTEDPYSNMIRSTTMAMAAVIGGADRLFVLPADSKSEKPVPFARRIARNVQHILKHESYFDRVDDPAAGSYFIDELTWLIAKDAWKKYQENA